MYSCVFLCCISLYNTNILPFINEVGHQSLGHHLHGDSIPSCRMEMIPQISQVKDNACNLITYRWV